MQEQRPNKSVLEYKWEVRTQRQGIGEYSFSGCEFLENENSSTKHESLEKSK